MQSPASAEYPCHQCQKEQEWAQVLVCPHGVPGGVCGFHPAHDISVLTACPVDFTLHYQMQTIALQRLLNYVAPTTA